MPILTATDLCRRYGERIILDGVSMTIRSGERVGLVGRNGSGKSTLARLLGGQEQGDRGQVVRRQGIQVAMLAQEPRLAPEQTALEVVLSALGPWQAALAEHESICARIEAGAGDLPRLMEAQARAAQEIERLGGWDRRHQAEAILGHVGIPEPEVIVGTLSGGERRRVALAQILVAPPDLAILDEPTNHLELAAVTWLENWLQERFTGALLLVTHDRYLLDRVTTRTLEIDQGHINSYDGGWESYLAAKAERQAHDARVDANRRNALRRELEWLRRSPQARTTKQKARVDRAVELQAQPTAVAHKQAQIRIEEARSGSTVLRAHQLGITLGGTRLLREFTTELVPGARVGIVGANGCGKTSLLRVLTGVHPPSEGEVSLGKNTRIAMVDQHRTGLRDEASVFDNVGIGRSGVTLGDERLDIRAYLERFLFAPGDQRRLVSTLSGGERARVALAQAFCEATNLVVLDEPTNDLDVDTLAVLEDTLLSFGGTVLLVTHDRWLLDRVATVLWVFDNGRIIQDAGGYADFIARHGDAVLTGRARKKNDDQPTADPLTPARPSAVPEPTVHKPLNFAERRELEGLLDRVEQAEQRVATLQQALGEADFYRSSESERRDHLQALQAAQSDLAGLLGRWEVLAARAG